eukprot:NP_497434.1 Uncharacterized protein CELE_Y22D7AL.12 [Caenorhabditis elegans]
MPPPNIIKVENFHDPIPEPEAHTRIRYSKKCVVGYSILFGLFAILMQTLISENLKKCCISYIPNWSSETTAVFVFNPWFMLKTLF